MKILIVINDYLNKSNGMCISTQRFVKEFRSLGHEVRIITNNRYGELDYPLEVVKIPVFADVIEKEGYTFAKVDRQVIRSAVQWADVVHLEDPFLVCRRAAIEAAKLNKPITGTFHMYPENMTYAIHMGHSFFTNYRIMRFFLKGVYNRCDYVHCPTEDVKNRLQKYRIKGNLDVISNGIDEYFLGQERTRAFDGTLRVLSVGRYAVEKNQKVLIEAVSLCKNKDNIRLVMPGKGPKEKSLRNLAKRLDVRVDFGFMPQEQLRQEMLESDLYVHCASIEVEGMSCMEAFACGCVPVISNARLASTKSFALHEENVFKRNNPEHLAKRIDYFFENPDVLSAQSKEYMKYAKGLSVGCCAKKLVDMLEQAYGGSAK